MYISHYMFIVIVVVLIVRPYKLDLFAAAFVNFVGSLILIYTSYMLIETCMNLVSRKKKRSPVNTKYEKKVDEVNDILIRID
jgi:hypothetical protein